MNILEYIKKLFHAIFSSEFNLNYQKGCKNSPVINGNNNQVNINNTVLSKERPDHPDDGDIWYRVIDDEEETQ